MYLRLGARSRQFIVTSGLDVKLVTLADYGVHYVGFLPSILARIPVQKCGIDLCCRRVFDSAVFLDGIQGNPFASSRAPVGIHLPVRAGNVYSPQYSVIL